MGDILSPVLPAGIRLLMPWGFFHRLNCIHCWTVVERHRRSNIRLQLGIGWGRCQIGTSIWISSHGQLLHLGSALCGLPKAPWSPYCHLPTTPPCWEGLSSGKPTQGHPVWKDCTARSPETSSADLEATYYTAPLTGSAISAST